MGESSFWCRPTRVVPDQRPLNGRCCLSYSSVDIGASAKLELVDKFCYLGDMLSVDRDADAAVEARIRIGWNKFRQLVPLITNKDVSFDYERKVVQ